MEKVHSKESANNCKWCERPERKTKKTCPFENVNILGAKMGQERKGKRKNKYRPLSSVTILQGSDKPAVIPKYVISLFVGNARFSPFCVCEVCTTVWALRMGNVHHGLSPVMAGCFQHFGGSANFTKPLKINYLMDACSTIQKVVLLLFFS